MSRSNPSDAVRNPSTRWLEFAGGSDGGFVRYYDKETKKNVPLGEEENGSNFLFVFLDELATVSGWHDPSESGIFANEVRDTRQDTFVVRSFKGGELASGLYAKIKDRIAAVGGHFLSSCYIAYKDGDELKLGNIRFKGAALSAWMDFKKQCPTKKDAAGKSVKAYYIDAVKIKGFTEDTKGRITYRVPVFTLVPLSEATNKQALGLDAELQAYLSDYLKRPRAEAASVAEKQSEEHQDESDGEVEYEDTAAGVERPNSRPGREEQKGRQSMDEQNGRVGLPDATPVARRNPREEQRQRIAASRGEPFDEPVFAEDEIPF